MERVVLTNKLRLPFQSGQNLLDVLREHAGPVSCSCLSGRCGTCRCRVIAGSVIDHGPESGQPHNTQPHNEETRP
ncbi:MAG: 2Fe-2S iron-sulfur cluster-binding protein [Parazoarcus communis]